MECMHGYQKFDQNTRVNRCATVSPHILVAVDVVRMVLHQQIEGNPPAVRYVSKTGYISLIEKFGGVTFIRVGALAAHCGYLYDRRVDKNNKRGRVPWSEFVKLKSRTFDLFVY